MTFADRLRRRRFEREIARVVRPAEFAAYGAGAIVHPPLSITDRSRVSVGAGSYVLANATFALGPAGSVSIGARTYLGRDLHVTALGEVLIGDDVMGSDRLLFSDTGPTAGGVVAERELAPPRPVVVEDGVFLGTGAMILAGVTIGARSLVGAGAVVTRSVAPNSVVVGNPARVVRRFDADRGEWVSAG